MARVGIIGSAGRMGRALAEAIAAAGHDVSGGIDQGGDPMALAQASDVLVDFSAPAALEFNLDAAIHAAFPSWSARPGLAERHHWLVDAAAVSVPVLQTGNTSLGVTLLAHLVREAASRLGEDWDIEIVETHHRMKVDAPSARRCCWAKRRRRARRGACRRSRARARRGDRREEAGHHRLCGPARRHRGGRPHRAFPGRQRADCAVAPCREPGDLCARGGARGGMAARQEPGRYSMPEVLGL
jgi:4-hydroxy-tetrahydrodipicolinate reductase